MMSYNLLIYEKLDAVVRITLNRPEVLNALNFDLKREMETALDEAVADEDVRAVILTGAGRAFSAGYDISVNYDTEDSKKKTLATVDEWREKMKDDFNNVMKVWDCVKPVIAAVNGYAVGGGMDLSMVCDLTVASDRAKFGEPEIRHSSAPPTLILPWLTGLKNAKEILYMGDLIDAQEAHRLGLVNRVVPHDSLQDEALKLANRLALVPPKALRINKEAIHRTYDMMGLRQALAYNVETASIIHATEESLEWARYGRKHGLKKFLGKRDGPFKSAP
jgi:enoyl-CoA hydratase/carnithine racemase